MVFMITFRKLVCRCVFGGLLYLGHDFTLEFGVDNRLHCDYQIYKLIVRGLSILLCRD